MGYHLHNKVGRRKVATAVLLSFLIQHMSSCSLADDSEYLIFASLGDKPFNDAVVVLIPTRAKVELLLSPNPKRSYVSVSGHSLEGPLSVVVHELALNGSVSDHLELYTPKTQSFVRFMLPEGNSDNGQLSNDGKRIVYTFLGAPATRLPRLWVYVLSEHQAKALISDPSQNHRYAYPAWRPGSSEIGYLLLESTERGLLSHFMIVDADGGSPRLAFDDAVGAFCFSPDGLQAAVLGAKGIEVVTLATKTRNLLISWGQLGGRTYIGGGLSWSHKHQTLAIALADRVTKTSEIWTVPLKGESLKRIHSSSARIMSLSYIGK